MILCSPDGSYLLHGAGAVQGEDPQQRAEGGEAEARKEGDEAGEGVEEKRKAQPLLKYRTLLHMKVSAILL